MTAILQLKLSWFWAINSACPKQKWLKYQFNQFNLPEVILFHTVTELPQL
jgi:hypothetical protein